MKESKPEWYARLQKGPIEQTVFDAKMRQKVQERAHGRGYKPAKKRLSRWVAAGVAAIILVVCSVLLFPGSKAAYLASQSGGSAPSVMTVEYFHEHLRIHMSEKEVLQLLGEPTDRESVVRDFEQPHLEDPNNLATWSQVTVSRYDYGVSSGYQVQPDLAQANGFDLPGLENGNIKSQLVLVWDNKSHDVERAIFKYSEGAGLITAQTGPDQRRTPLVEPPKNEGVRAIGESSYGTFELRPIKGTEEKTQRLGAPSCLGLETDMNIRGDYEMFFKSKSGEEKSVYAMNGIDFIQHEDKTVTMRKYDFPDLELFLLIPRYTDCHGLELYAFGVDKKSGDASMYTFKDRNQDINVFMTSPVNLPTQVDDRLIIEGGRAAGADGATRYTFKPDLRKRLLMLEIKEEIP